MQVGSMALLTQQEIAVLIATSVADEEEKCASSAQLHL